MTQRASAAARATIVPQQRRSRESQERVLDAAERVLRAEGFARFSLPRVSTSAGISIGGIYRRFTHKEALLLVIQARTYERMDEEFRRVEAAASAQNHTLEARLSVLVAGLANMLKRHAPVIKAIVEASWEYSAIADRGTQIYAAHATRFTALVLRHTRVARCHEDPKHAAEFCFSCVYELVASHFGFGRRVASVHSGWPTLVNDLQQLCIGFLTQSTAERDVNPTRS